MAVGKEGKRESFRKVGQSKGNECSERWDRMRVELLVLV